MLAGDTDSCVDGCARREDGTCLFGGLREGEVREGGLDCGGGGGGARGDGADVGVGGGTENGSDYAVLRGGDILFASKSAPDGGRCGRAGDGTRRVSLSSQSAFFL